MSPDKPIAFAESRLIQNNLRKISWKFSKKKHTLTSDDLAKGEFHLGTSYAAVTLSEETIQCKVINLKTLQLLRKSSQVNINEIIPLV